MDDPETPDKKGKLTLPVPHTYDVGYRKPPVETRFKPGQSGNPKGRPRGAKKKVLPALAEERLKTLVIEEAYRTIPIIERGQCIDVPMIQAVLRSLAMNAVKGNNRSAQIFSTLVSTTEAANRKLAADVFGNFFDYRQKWQAEIARCRRLGLKEPNPIPHPDDIILDTKTMSVRIVGPMVADDVPRYQLGASLYEAYDACRIDTAAELEAAQDDMERQRLEKKLKNFTEMTNQLKMCYGPRSERIKDPIIREVEDWLGVPFETEDDQEA